MRNWLKEGQHEMEYTLLKIDGCEMKAWPIERALYFLKRRA